MIGKSARLAGRVCRLCPTTARSALFLNRMVDFGSFPTVLGVGVEIVLQASPGKPSWDQESLVWDQVTESGNLIPDQLQPLEFMILL